MGMLPGMPFLFSNLPFPPSIAISLLQQQIKHFQTWQEMTHTSEISEPSTSNGLLRIASPNNSQSLATVLQNQDESFDPTGPRPLSDEAAGLYAHILTEPVVKKLNYSPCSPTRNRYGRVYVSGRPLVIEDRLKIVELHKKGYKKINIAKELGVTHSCVSKVLRRYLETGSVEAKNIKQNQQQRKLKREFTEVNTTTIEPIVQKKKILNFSIDNILSPQRELVIFTSK